MTFVTLWTPDRPIAVGAPASRRRTLARHTAERHTAERHTAERHTAECSAQGTPNGVAFAPLLARLLGVTPHAVLAPAEDGVAGGTYVWADGRGLPARWVAREVLRHARERGIARPRVGVARVAVVAEVAARWGAWREGTAAGDDAAPLTGVAPDAERAFLAAHPLTVLLPSATEAGIARVAAALVDVGVGSCGALARIAREAVEVRFGAAGVALWKLARADDPRRVFRHGEHALPSASLEWSEFDLREPERLLFVAGRLVARVCEALEARGEGAGAMLLVAQLAGGGAVERHVRAARDTADPATWRRLLRAELERVELPDAVSGLALRVEAARAAAAPQSDLFDRGGQTAGAAAAAVARLIEDGAGRPVRPVTHAHPLPERRLGWETATVESALRAARPSPGVRAVREGPPAPAAPRLTLHAGGAGRAPSGRGPADRAPLGIVRGSGADPSGVDPSEPAPLASEPAPKPAPEPEPAQEPMNLRVLPRPRALAMTTRAERGHAVPMRYRERLAEGVRAPRGMPLVEVLTAVGPDRISTGGEQGAPVSREYWQCLTERGELVLVYRDLAAADPGDPEGGWFLHGWWD